MADYKELLNMIMTHNGVNLIFAESFEIDTFVENPIEKGIDLGSLTNMVFEVFTKEGESIPHFHLFKVGSQHTKDGSNRKTFHTCICLNEPTYFNHGTKTGKLTNDDIDIMVNILKSKTTHKDYRGKTVWEAMVTRWNNCRNTKVDIAEMPDYSLLKG